jgi:serine/threonine protein kinase
MNICRCEGTPAYLPPEAFTDNGFVASGDDISTDSWALGCITYFCLHGKPRFFGTPEEVSWPFSQNRPFVPSVTIYG